MDSESSSSMSFQMVILTIAIVALILTLSVIGYMMYSTAQSQPFPPLDGASRCPDSWVEDADGNCTTTTSGQNIGYFILDNKNCTIDATTGQRCNNGLTEAYKTVETCNGDWVQGNVSNNLDSTKCYLLAKAWKGSPLDITHEMTTLDKDVEWAKKYGITWDGFN